MVLVTRASSASASASAGAKRVRKAPSLPDFELEQLPRSAIRKKPRLKEPREKKKAAPKKVVVIDKEEEEEEAREQLDAAVRDLVGDFDAAVQAHEGHGLLCSDELFGPDGPEMTMPQFDPDLEPRVLGRTWTPDEDVVLLSAVKEMGAKNWSVIANRLPGRVGKQCRERWHNHLNPKISKRAWTDAEDVIIQMGVLELGHKWSKIARRLTGRTDNDVKNRYNARVKKLGGGATILEEGPRISQEDFVHELVRRNVLAEEKMTPGRFSPNQIEALAAGNTEIVDTPGCRWSNDEHARLMRAIPEGALPNQIDWGKVSQAVPSRSPQSCRRHWANYLRGGWKHTPFRGEELEIEPSPLALLTDLDPEEGAPVETVDVVAMVESMTEVVESMTTHSALLAEYADHPDLELMAIETYSEGSCTNTWSNSSVLVVGKPGLSFRFHTPGTTAPLAAPPENKDSEIDSGSQLETTALSKWLKQKALEDEKASTERLEKLRVTLDAIAEKEREGKKNKKKSNAVNTVDTHFRTVKSTAKAYGSTGAWSKERWLQGLQVEPAAPPLVAFAVPVQA